MPPTPAVEDFVDAAREFVAWAEGEPGEPDDEVRTAQRHLTRLYHLATFLREVELEDDEYNPFDTIEKGDRIYRGRFKDFPVQYFGIVFNPLTMPPEQPVVGDGADALRDIWADLARGLHAWDAGNRRHAEWTWRLHFNHWGQHATELLYALHMYFYNRDTDWRT